MNPLVQLRRIMSVISRKREELLGPKLSRQTYALGALDKGVQAKLKELRPPPI